MAGLLHRPAVLVSVAVVTLGTVAGSIVGLTTSHPHTCAETVYHGRYVPMSGLPAGKAYSSTLTITPDQGSADFGWYAYAGAPEGVTYRPGCTSVRIAG